MGLDLTTFVLEIVNFLVLLWLLSRFLYRPVQAAIAARQQQAQEAARALEAERQSLDGRERELAGLRARLDDEREAARQRLDAELAAERSKRLEALDAELAADRAKAEARDAAQRALESRRQEALADQRARAFLQHYLGRLAGPELESAIAGLFLGDLAALDGDAKDRLRATLAGSPVVVATAFEPAEDERTRIAGALEALLGAAPRLDWQIDRGLLSGVSVRLDGHVLEASLARGIDAFGASVPEAEWIRGR